MPTKMLTQFFQLAGKEETTENTLNTPAIADADNRVVTLSARVIPQNNPRNITRRTFSRIPMIKGGARVEAAFGVELAGHITSVTTEPSWSKYLKACGMQRVTLRSCTPGAIAGGPFEHGELATQATSNARVRIIKDTFNGATILRYELLSTAVMTTGQVLTGSRSGATTTPSAVAVADAQAWIPCSFPIVALTLGTFTGSAAVGVVITGATSGAKGEVLVDAAQAANPGVYVRMLTLTPFAAAEVVSGTGLTSATVGTVTTSGMPSLTLAAYLDGRIITARGCRGNFELNARVNEPVVLSFNFQGVYDTWADGPNLVEPTYVTKVPPVFKDAALVVSTSAGAQTTSLVVNEVTVSYNNNLALRASVTDSQGFEACHITNRATQARMAPDSVRTDLVDWKTFLVGQSAPKLDFAIGTSSGNKFEVHIPSAQVADVGDGNRDEVRIDQLTLDCTCGFYGSGAARAGTDNEVILILV